MEPFIHIRFLGMSPSENLKELARRHMRLLAPHWTRLERISVQLECWHRHHEQGTFYRATLYIDLRDIDESIEAGSTREEPDVDTALGESFKSALRQLVYKHEVAHSALSPEQRHALPLHAIPPDPGTYGSPNEAL